jgi:uncharacterized membrane protein YgcG
LELGQAALALVKYGNANMTPASAARILALADSAFGAAREVLAMRDQYFKDNVQYWVEAARKTAFFVEQEHEAVHYLSHRSVRESLNQELEKKAAKLLAKTHLDSATGGSGGGGNGAGCSSGSGSSASGAAVDALEFKKKEMGRVNKAGGQPI